MARVKERWDFRVEPETDSLVRQAAASSHRTLTDFVVDAAVLEAERLLADRTTFALPPEEWEQFVALLDRSPRDNPGLEKLFAEPSVFSSTQPLAYRPPEPLEKRHRLDDFDCGEPALDEWLKRHARAAHGSGSARVYVTTLADGETVVGYYALAAAQVAPEAATERALKGQPRTRPVPAVLLARLAVDREHQRAGLGRSLLQDVMLRCLDAAESIGARVLLVHAKHDAAKAWYLQYGFEESPTDPLHLLMLLKDMRGFLQRRGVSQLSERKPTRRSRRLSPEKLRLIPDEVKHVASHERDRDEMRVIREQLAELAPRRSTQTSSSA